MAILRFLTLAAVAGLFTACEKSGSNAPNESQSAGAADQGKAGNLGPSVVTTKSGVEMVMCPEGSL